MADYIPFSNIQFDLWQNNLLSTIKENQIIWEINSGKLEALIEKQSLWTAMFSKASNKQNRTATDVQAKNDALYVYKKWLRIFVAENLANNSLIPDSDRIRMGLTVKSVTRTASPVPSSFPMGMADFSVRWQHTLSFNDNTSPRSKAKPAGVHGCEIWAKVGGDAPKNVSELSYMGIATTNTYTARYSGNEVGNTVYYWLRWVNTRGEQGPWGATFSAMVVG
jgi:hypothetical protein